jgi:sulfatase maturation enzyme AslB (radical SAM superfamily)
MKPAELTSVSSVQVILTAGCNLRCGYCYQNAKDDERRMSWDTLRAAVDVLLRSEQRDRTLTFYGGEPLLRWDLIEQAVAYAGVRLGPGQHLRYSLITNGTLLDEAKAAFLARHAFKTRISFDGIPAAQQFRGAGTWAALDSLLDRLRRDHPRFYRDQVEVSATFFSRTIPQLGESFDYFIEKKARAVHLAPIDTFDPGWRPELKDELDRQFERIFRSSLRVLRSREEVPLMLFRKTATDDEHAPRGRSMCGAGRGQTLAVDVDGEVNGCAVFARSFQKFPTELLREPLDRMRMGDVRAPELSSRLALYPGVARDTRIFNAKQDKHSSYGSCATCEYLRTCSVCPVSIGRIPGNIDPDRVPDPLCAFNLVVGKWRARFPARADPLQVLLGRAPLPRSLERVRRAASASRQRRRTESWESNSI